MTVGQRAALADASYFAAPCSTNAPLGTLTQCTIVDVTGRSGASTCGDGQCWLEATVDGTGVWIPDRACGIASPSLLGEPTDPACAA